jgi:heme/copper-type cytochrome/quinol oxidase subunit 2
MATKKTICGELIACSCVAAVLVGVPLLLWYWRAVHVPAQHPPGAKIIDLTAVSEGGIWTRDSMVGYTYWWKKPARAEALRFTQGDIVVFRLHSPDVEHSFGIPDLNVGPVEVPAGHTVELTFKADRVGEWRFFCLRVCGHDHGRLEGRIIVTPMLVARGHFL